MFACRSLSRFDHLLKLRNSYVKSKPVNYSQGQYFYHCLSLDLRIGATKDKLGSMDKGKRKIDSLVWRPVCVQASSIEEHVIKDGMAELEGGSQTQEGNDVADVVLSPKTAEVDIDDGAFKEELLLSAEKHSLSIEVGASLIRFVRGKEGLKKEKIEKKTGVQIILPSSMHEDSIMIEGTSADSVTKASEEIQRIIDEAVKTPSLDYSHFVSLPLAIHPELVQKLVNFQNSILGTSDPCVDENLEGNSDGDNSEDDAQEQQLGKGANISDLGIEKSIFVKPKTFHLTVLMLKLWNKERVNLAVDVLKSISSKVMEALDNRPLFIRLKGLDCMKGSLAKARVLYAPLEEIGSENRLLRACQVIIDAFIEAGLVLEKDAKQGLKLHATVMNARHRKRKGKRGKFDSFDARGIFKQFGSEDWGEYLIREAHLSRRFKFDVDGYYHCCASVPFPERMQID